MHSVKQLFFWCFKNGNEILKTQFIYKSWDMKNPCFTIFLNIFSYQKHSP